jgi:hypothetical protein
LSRFAAGVGITVRGILTAEGTEDDRILFTSEEEPPAKQHNRTVRLVDGPLVSEGIVQVSSTLYHIVQCTSSDVELNNFDAAPYNSKLYLIKSCMRTLKSNYIYCISNVTLLNHN